ncbi:MAG: DUF2313 domain-containing protein [Pseudoflavonifractor sp.]|nr:DUF2313 domain-containing protein [Pseudoflavonifractor sp.]
MSCAEHLWALLRPLGPYQRGGTYTAGELAGEGNALDGVEKTLSLLEREGFLDTAESWGLEKLESLLVRRPVADTSGGRRKALAALLRISGDSFTLQAVNDNLKGCGLNAVASETADPGVVEVRFPDVPGIPDEFDALRKIIEDILPCHLQVDYVYWYITWAMVEEKFSVWEKIEAEGYTWEQLEKLVR